jgi:hypothetical protein
VAPDQTLITVEADGTIRLNDQAYSSAMLPTVLKNVPAERRARVAVANAVEDNDVARDLINGLSARGVQFQVIPQAAATSSGKASGALAGSPASSPADFAADDLIRRLRAQWDQSVAPRDAQIREAARAHYEVITQLRAEQQRLIDEADKVQRLIDQLEKQYQDMTAPKPQ